jgi:alkylhydroperoxidase/carboxymuconolactone decarboxylase family protein YurZ
MIMKFRNALVGVCISAAAFSPVLAAAAQTQGDAKTTQTASLGLTNQILATIRSLPPTSTQETFEAQIAGIIEGSGLSPDEIRSALTAAAATAGLPANAVAAARSLIATAGRSRGTAALGGGGAPAYSSAPSFGGGGGSDY